MQYEIRETVTDFFDVTGMKTLALFRIDNTLGESVLLCEDVTDDDGFHRVVLEELNRLGSQLEQEDQEACEYDDEP